MLSWLSCHLRLLDPSMDYRVAQMLAATRPRKKIEEKEKNACKRKKGKDTN